MAAVSVTASPPVQLSPLNAKTGTQYRQVIIYNEGTAEAFVGTDDQVTAASGLPLPAGAALSLDNVMFTTRLYAVTASGTADVRVLEVQ